jgi:16S rRNA (uracil1498-N3)-methyltransferase
MTPFYLNQVTEESAFLRGEEAHHCIKVMRKKVGDEIIGIDGMGSMLKTRILSLGKDSVTLQVITREENWGEKPTQINLLISPLHKPDRFEWLIEKAVELGVTNIIPYIGKHTVKSGLRMDRMERIMVAALKQSMRSRLPSLQEPKALELAMASISPDLGLIAHAELGKPLFSYTAQLLPAVNVSILIGPEGDFSSEELETAIQMNYQPVSLGNNRLRSETAAIHLLGLVKNSLQY